MQISAAMSPREMSPLENTRPFTDTDSLTNERKTEILQNTRKANSLPDGNNVVENNFFGPSIKRVENYIKKTSAGERGGASFVTCRASFICTSSCPIILGLVSSASVKESRPQTINGFSSVKEKKDEGRTNVCFAAGVKK